MKDPDLYTDLDAAIADELHRLKKLPASLLRVLSRDGVTGLIRVREQSYEAKAWSVPVSEVAGSFVVLVGAFEPGSPGPTHLRGFLVRADQTYTDLTERELRSYD
jgi:hypothetical protein